MDCPHCGSENLIGARTCVSCGKSVTARPAASPPHAASAGAPPHGDDRDATRAFVDPPFGHPSGPASSGRGHGGGTRAELRSETRADTVRQAPPGRDGRPRPDVAGPARADATVAQPWGQGPAVIGSDRSVTERGGRSPRSSDPGVSPATADPESAFCRVCKDPFDLPPPGSGATGDLLTTCASCRDLSKVAGGGDLGENDVRMHPGTTAEASEGDFASKLASGGLRPRIVGARRVGLRPAAIAVFVALAACVATLAVVVVKNRKTDRIAPLVGETTGESATLVLGLDDGRALRWDTNLRTRFVREEIRSTFSGLTKVAEVDQIVTQRAEVFPVRDEDAGLVVDANAECRVVSQTGTLGAENAADAELFPFRGHHGSVRVRASRRPADAATAQLDGAPVTPLRDLPPFLALGDLGRGAGTWQVGDTWRATWSLPLLPDRSGKQVVLPFPVELRYVGRAQRQGVACAAVRVQGLPWGHLPRPFDESYNRQESEIGGVVFVDLTCGLVLDASILFDVRLRREAGRIEETYSASGRLDVRRQ